MQDIHKAIRDGNINLVKLLLSRNVDVELKNRSKCRPIHIACAYGHVDIVELLLSRNCNIEAKDIEHCRPIHFACQFGHVDIVELLHLRSCHIKSRDLYNKRPMEIAYQNDHSDVMKFLWSKYCSIDEYKEGTYKYQKRSRKCNILIHQLDEIEKSLVLIKRSSLREQKEYLIKMLFLWETRNIQLRICKDIRDIIQMKIDTERQVILNKLLILICRNDSQLPLNEIIDSSCRNGKYFMKQMNAQSSAKKVKFEKRLCGICYAEDINRILRCGHCYCMSCINKLKRCHWCNRTGKLNGPVIQI